MIVRAENNGNLNYFTYSLL